MSRRAHILVYASGVLLVLAAGAGGRLLTRRTGADEYVQSQIGDLRLIYPAAYARFPGGRLGGRIDSLDMAATFPDLKPAGDAAAPLSDESAAGAPAIVFLSIGPHERKVDQADLVVTLYDRFLDPEIGEAAAGLLKRRFQDGSPYQGEDLYFAPPEGRAFAARCTRPTTPPDGLPETCIASIYEGGADVELRFSRGLLPQWEKLSEGSRALIRSMLAR